MTTKLQLINILYYFSTRSSVFCISSFLHSSFSHSSVSLVGSFYWSFPVKSIAFLCSCLLPQWNHPQYRAHISWYCSSALPHFQIHLPLPLDFLLVHLALAVVECNFSRSHLGSHFWNFICFFSLAHIFASSQLWPESVRAPRIVRISFILRLNTFFTCT